MNVSLRAIINNTAVTLDVCRPYSSCSLLSNRILYFFSKKRRKNRVTIEFNTVIINDFDFQKSGNFQLASNPLKLISVLSRSFELFSLGVGEKGK